MLSLVKEKLSQANFFVARNRAPQCIIHRKYIQSISNVSIDAQKVKYQATAMMTNGLEIMIAKNKKVDFEDWYKI